MQLFWCPKCELYVSYIRADVTLNFGFSQQRDVADKALFYCTAEDVPEIERKAEELINPRCTECGSVAVLHTLSVCPHPDWDNRGSIYGRPRRECRFCGYEQQGKVVF